MTFGGKNVELLENVKRVMLVKINNYLVGIEVISYGWTKRGAKDRWYKL